VSNRTTALNRIGLRQDRGTDTPSESTSTGVLSGAAYHAQAEGFMNRANGLSPQSTDIAYLRGYCQRIIFEIDQELFRDVV